MPSLANLAAPTPGPTGELPPTLGLVELLSDQAILSPISSGAGMDKNLSHSYQHLKSISILSHALQRTVEVIHTGGAGGC